MTDIEHGAAAPTSTAHILYLMHAISPFTLWTLALLALLVGAITRDSVRGTWVETHYSWLLRTCLWGIFWVVALTVIGIFFVWIPWGILTIWYLYRVIRGWLRLNDRLPAP